MKDRRTRARAEAPVQFNPGLGRVVRAGLPGDRVVGEKAIESPVAERSAARQVDRGLAQDPDVPVRIEVSHVPSLKQRVPNAAES
jgi:hypothetical protein